MIRIFVAIKYRLPPEQMGPNITSISSSCSMSSVANIPPFGYGKHELGVKTKL